MSRRHFLVSDDRFPVNMPIRRSINTSRRITAIIVIILIIILCGHNHHAVHPIDDLSSPPKTTKKRPWSQMCMRPLGSALKANGQKPPNANIWMGGMYIIEEFSLQNRMENPIAPLRVLSISRLRWTGSLKRILSYLKISKQTNPLINQLFSYLWLPTSSHDLLPDGGHVQYYFRVLLCRTAPNWKPASSSPQKRFKGLYLM